MFGFGILTSVGRSLNVSIQNVQWFKGTPLFVSQTFPFPFPIPRVPSSI